jgi:hypothetical protein
MAEFRGKIHPSWAGLFSWSSSVLVIHKPGVQSSRTAITLLHFRRLIAQSVLVPLSPSSCTRSLLLGLNFVPVIDTDMQCEGCQYFVSLFEVCRLVPRSCVWYPSPPFDTDTHCKGFSWFISHCLVFAFCTVLNGVFRALCVVMWLFVCYMVACLGI